MSFDGSKAKFWMKDDKDWKKKDSTSVKGETPAEKWGSLSGKCFKDGDFEVDACKVK